MTFFILTEYFQSFQTNSTISNSDAVTTLEKYNEENIFSRIA